MPKENAGVKFRLFRQDLFDRRVDAKLMKSNDSKETVRAFSTMITKMNCSKKSMVDKERKLPQSFKQTVMFIESKITLQ